MKPIIYGNIAKHFGKKREEDGHTHQVSDQKAVSPIYPTHKNYFSPALIFSSSLLEVANLGSF